jgi:hypothetical protein
MAKNSNISTTMIIISKEIIKLVKFILCFSAVLIILAVLINLPIVGPIIIHCFDSLFFVCGIIMQSLTWFQNIMENSWITTILAILLIFFAYRSFKKK